MSMPTHAELLKRFAPVDEPEIMARRKHILQALLDMDLRRGSGFSSRVG